MLAAGPPWLPAEQAAGEGHAEDARHALVLERLGRLARPVKVNLLDHLVDGFPHTARQELFLRAHGPNHRLNSVQNR